MIALKDISLITDTNINIMDNKTGLPAIIICKSQTLYGSGYSLINLLQKEVVKINVYSQFGLCIWLKQEEA